MNRIAVLTSGGDAPGMNAAIRAAVRAGSEKEMKMFGIPNGYDGLLTGNFQKLRARDVGGIIQMGGTFLGSSRSEEFRKPESRVHALKLLHENRIDALIVIGGNGSQTGASELSKLGFPVIGIASTIDNDLYGSDITLGVDTATNIALEAIDRLKTTASSHRRAVLVEVMGRKSGYLALMCGIAGGAETVVIPEVEMNPNDVAQDILGAYRRGKSHALVVVAEGAAYNASALAQAISNHPEMSGYTVRTTILGHVQRGGVPSASDRILAARFGVAAIEALALEKYGVLIGIHNSSIIHTPLDIVAKNKKELDLSLFQMAKVLAT
ncbi:MAG TPA: ATP-dependent 6-phosphofructokinase [Candidatus Kapabacteria bacterium]|jgi:6-phosphofructokinase 1